MSFLLSIAMALGKKIYIQYKPVNKIISENKTQQSLHNHMSVSTIKIHRGKYRT